MKIWRGPSKGVALRLFSVAVVLPGSLVLAATTGGATSVAQPGATTHYGVVQPVCQQPSGAAQASCFAMRRVEVSKGTAGAVAFKEGGTSYSTGPAGGYTPADLASAYEFSPTATGSGQTVAIVDAYNDPNINADLQTFDANYGLPACSTSNGCLSVVGEATGAGLPANDTSGWSVEESLDVETVRSVCQECKIILVEANSNSISDLATADEEAYSLGATEVSNSWGGTESSGDTSYEADFNHPGIVVTASTGDSGYFNWDKFADANAPNFPSSFGDVVAVGGTSLSLNSNGTRNAETVWDDDNLGAVNPTGNGGSSGGGCSTVFPAPSWQTSVSDWPATACGTYRLASDVSADADPFTGFDVYDSFSCGNDCLTGWTTLGGTSLASPIIASMYALAGGTHSLSYPAQVLYSHIGTSALYDVTSGGNGFCDGEAAANCLSANDGANPNTEGYGTLDCAWTATGAPSAGDLACDAGTGYDGPSGVGTPNGLGGFEPGGSAPTVTAVSPSAGPVGAQTSVRITGAGFTGAMAVHFGSSAAESFTVNNDGLITALSPGEGAGTVDVTVTTPAGTSPDSPADQFTFSSTFSTTTTTTAPTTTTGATTTTPATTTTAATTTTTAATTSTTTPVSSFPGWTSVAPPGGLLVANYGAPEPVSCAPGTTYCVAVLGSPSVVTPDGQEGQGVAVTSNLTNWTSYNSLPSEFDFVYSISCPTSAQCVAVGTGMTDAPVIAFSGNGGVSWTEANMSAFASAPGWPQSVSCPSALVCYTVGGTAEPYAPMAAVSTNGGQAWTLLDNDLPTPEDYNLEGVSCSSVSSCVAVGAFSGSGPAAAISTTSGGTAWSQSSSPVLSSFDGEASVSCPTGTTVCFLGTGVSSGGGTAAATSTDSGMTWSSVPLPRAGDGWVGSISCSNALTCWTAGYATAQSLAGTGNGGSTWQADTGSAPNQQSSVSCASTEVCVATANNQLLTTTDNGGVTPGAPPTTTTTTAQTTTTTHPTTTTTSAPASPPVLDGSVASGQWSSTNSVTTGSVSTTHSNDVIVLAVSAGTASTSAAATVSSVTDTGGLSWTRQARVTGPGSASGEYGGAEIWYALAPSALSGDKVTITYSSANAVDDGTYYLFGLSGANTTTPFDPNASLPASGTGEGTTGQGPFITASTVSTTAANDYGIDFGSIFNGTSGGGAAVPLAGTDLGPSGLSDIGSQDNTGAVWADVSTLAGGGLSAALSKATAGWDFTNTNNFAWAVLFEAVQPAGGSGGGTTTTTTAPTTTTTKATTTTTAPTTTTTKATTTTTTAPTTTTTKATTTTTAPTTTTTKATTTTTAPTTTTTKATTTTTAPTTTTTSGSASPPVPDGSVVSGQWTGTNSLSTGALVTSHAGDVLVLAISAETDVTSGTPTVSTVSSTSGLVWKRQAQVSGAGYYAGQYEGAEVWYAVAPSALSAETVTITYSSANAVDDGSYYLFALSGANTTTPFDPNSSLPGSAIGSGSKDKGPFITSATVSTSSAGDYDFAFGSIFNGTGGGSGVVSLGTTDLVPSGLSQIGSQNNQGGEYCDISTLAGGASTVALSGATAGWNFTSSHNNAWAVLFDAVQ